MRKILCTALIIISFTVCASADDFKVGVLAQLNMNEDEYRSFVLEGRKNVGFNFLSSGQESFIYYDSLLSLQMALNAREIQEVQLPEIVAEYFINSNPKAYTVSGITQFRTTYLAFGFLDRNADLRDKFNSALQSLKEDGTLSQLQEKYILSSAKDDITPTKPEKFDGAGKIRVALTGDLPPIDYVTADGTPAGFNMAIISEIGKRLKLNIEVINIEAGARSAAVASRRADVSFWYKGTKGVDNQPDIPENIILSEPYYEWNKFLHIKLKKK